jgi:Cohesin domain
MKYGAQRNAQDANLMRSSWKLWTAIGGIGVASALLLLNGSDPPRARSGGETVHGATAQSESAQGAIVQSQSAQRSIAQARAGAGESKSVVAPLSRDEPAAQSLERAAPLDVPVRRALDSGRAQPVFIALRAPETARLGEPIEVEVTGESENDFARVALGVQFDPRKLRVTGVRQGELMARTGATIDFSYGVDVQAGRVSIQLNQNAGADPVSGGGTLCSIKFVAMVPGPASLSLLDVAVGDQNNEGVAYSVLPPATVAVHE